MAIITRVDMGWSAISPARSAETDSGLVVHYNGASSWKLASKHCSECKRYWQWCRSFHTGPDRRWTDVGYAFFVCPHGNRYIGRDYKKEQAAQTGGNRTWTSVTTALGLGEIPTGLQVNGIRQLRHDLMKRGMRAAVRVHSDFNNTSCPGPILRDMVHTGVFSKAPTGVEDEMWEDFPVLNKDSKEGLDITTLRCLLVARGIVKFPNEPEKLHAWCNSKRWDNQLGLGVHLFQMESFKGQPDEWDSVVGPKTWKKLCIRK